ncbi:MAG: LptF/LptG family permease [Bacteroidia bacterium]|nr:LptF/LptG family permease [Bacteroidia bacterium]MDW8235670.1 LptF/LptG family permease [Bacteroidia bacterium]
MSRLDRYILRHFAVSFLGSLLLLVLILVAIDVAEKIDDFVEKKATLPALLRYYQNFIPFYATLLTPLMVFISVLFFTAKLAQRSEIVALLACGVSFWRILRPYLMLALTLSLLSIVLHAYVTPHNIRRIEEFEYKYVKNRVYFDKRQIHIKLTRDSYFFVRAFDKFDHVGFGAHLEKVEDNRLKQRLIAEEVLWDKEHKRWQLFRIWHFDKDKPPRYVDRLDTTLPLVPEDIIRSELYTRTMTLPELWAEYHRQLYVGGDFASLLEVELHERFAIPLATIGLTGLGFASASRKRRGGVAWQIGLGLVLAFIYVFLLTLAKSAFSGITGWIWVGVWLPNLIFFAVAGLWLWLAPK